MIVQITRTRNELFLLEKMLPIWKKYADGFVFLIDNSDQEESDNTYLFLKENKEKYNILNILKTNRKEENLQVESVERQKLFDEAFKYSKKIICLDTDEYLDGHITKEKLNYLLDNNKDTLFYLRWIQYVDRHKIRTDGPWKCVWSADRIASYENHYKYVDRVMHTTHLPIPPKIMRLEISDIFVAHLQWLDKKSVALKQYFWKITDYVNKLKFNADIIQPKAYDESVGNFNWNCEFFQFPLKVNSSIYSEDRDITKDYKWKFIQENIKKYNIPNLNDWGMGIHGD